MPVRTTSGPLAATWPSPRRTASSYRAGALRFQFTDLRLRKPWGPRPKVLSVMTAAKACEKGCFSIPAGQGGGRLLMPLPQKFSFLVNMIFVLLKDLTTAGAAAFCQRA